MATAQTLPPYELYSSAPGYLYNKPEWDAVNSAHPDNFDFGPLPEGWPTKFSGPHVWSGDELERNRMFPLRPRSLRIQTNASHSTILHPRPFRD